MQVSVAVGGSFTLCQDSYSKPCLFVAGGIGITALSSMLASLVEQQQQQKAEVSDSQRSFLLYSGQCAMPSVVCNVHRRSCCLSSLRQQGTSIVSSIACPFNSSTICAEPLHLHGCLGACTCTFITPALVFAAAAEPSEFALLQQLLHWQQAGAIDMQLHTTRTHGLPLALQETRAQQQQQLPAPGTAAGQDVKPPQVVQGRIAESHLRAAVQQLSKGSGSSSSSLGLPSRVQDVVAYVCGPPQMSDDVVKTLLGLGLPQGSVHTERWW
jgi:hypothetical protein